MALNFLWAAEPPHAHLLYAVLAVVCVITCVRAALLARALLGVPRRTRISSEDVTGGIDPGRIAAAALAGAIESKGSRRATATNSHGELEGVMRIADAKFTYGWHMAHARVTATKGLSKLTILMSVAVVSLGVYPTLRLAIYEPFTISEQVAFLRGIDLLMARLAIGLAVSFVVTGAALFFEGCLIRRKASWRLFQATVADEAPAAGG